MNKTVSIACCDNYQQDTVDRAVRRVLEPLGGVTALQPKGKHVLLKVNLLSANSPEKSVTTHPSIVEALAKEFVAAGARVTIADSPGGIYNMTSLSRVYRVCGMEAAAGNSGASLNFDLSFRRISFPEGRYANEFDIISPVLDSDIVISVAKLKTHGLSYYTGATKNLFGCIPGLEKAAFHSRYPNRYRFNAVLVDLCELVRPHLSIVDGVIGMEGDGPSAGKPKYVGVIGASKNPYALDMAMCDLVSLPPSQVPVLAEAVARKLVVPKVSDLVYVGEEPDKIRTQFMPPSGGGRSSPIGIISRFILPGKIRQRLYDSLTPWPVMTNKCIACKKCVEICPRQIISIENDRAVPYYSGCIRCYCCHEICPVQAIDLTRRLKK
jgi:uncharacterized protein (DUF362 family)/Pyruvate/2-oxoacid:ferredoxin oxidoreductase delta subunit